MYRKRGNTIFIAVFIILIFIVAGIYFYNKFIKNNPKIMTINSSESGAPSPKVKYQKIPDVDAYVWDYQSDLVLVNFSADKISEWKDGVSKDLASIGQFDMYRLAYFPTQKMVYMFGAAGEYAGELISVNLDTNERKVVPDGIYFSLDPNRNTMWGTNPIDLKDNVFYNNIFSLNPGGAIVKYTLQKSDYSAYISDIIPFVNNKWCLTVSGGKEWLVLWDLSSGGMIKNFEKVGGYALWTSKVKPDIAYLDSSKRLFIANSSDNWNPVVLSPNIEGPIRFLYSKSEVVYMSYNPTRGGQSFWAVNIETKKTRLLSEAVIESGHVTDFSISPDETKIAFLNSDKYELYVIDLTK